MKAIIAIIAILVSFNAAAVDFGTKDLQGRHSNKYNAVKGAAIGVAIGAAIGTATAGLLTVAAPGAPLAATYFTTGAGSAVLPTFMANVVAPMAATGAVYVGAIGAYLGYNHNEIVRDCCKKSERRN